MTVTDKTAASADASDSRSDAPEVKAPSMLDAVRKIREGAPESKTSTAPATKETPAASKDDAAADDKGEDPKSKADRKSAEDEPEGGYLPDSDLIGKDLRNVDLKRVRPELRETVRKMQKAEREKHEKYNALISAAEAKSKPETRPSDDSDDEDDNPFLDDVRQALKTKKGRQLLKEVLAEEGLNLDVAKEVVRETAEDRLLNRALISAAERYPDIAKDKEFFDEVVQTIADDEDLQGDFEDAEKKRDSNALARVFKAAAREVQNDRDEKARKRAEKEKADTKATRDQRTVLNPGSQAAKQGRKAPIADGPVSTLDRIKQVREQLSS